MKGLWRGQQTSSDMGSERPQHLGTGHGWQGVVWFDFESLEGGSHSGVTMSKANGEQRKNK